MVEIIPLSLIFLIQMETPTSTERGVGKEPSITLFQLPVYSQSAFQTSFHTLHPRQLGLNWNSIKIALKFSQNFMTRRFFRINNLLYILLKN